MSDWNVRVDNQVCVELDSESHAILVEIRDLLQLILHRLPSQNISVLPVPVDEDTRELGNRTTGTEI